MVQWGNPIGDIRKALILKQTDEYLLKFVNKKIHDKSLYTFELYYFT